MVDVEVLLSELISKYFDLMALCIWNDTYLNEEQRFMYKINQGYLTIFCIVFV